jgi:hypothetical protein
MQITLQGMSLSRPPDYLGRRPPDIPWYFALVVCQSIFRIALGRATEIAFKSCSLSRSVRTATRKQPAGMPS